MSLNTHDQFPHTHAQLPYHPTHHIAIIPIIIIILPSRAPAFTLLTPSHSAPVTAGVGLFGGFHHGHRLVRLLLKQTYT